MVLQGCGQDAHIVKPVLVNPRILGVDMDKAIREITKRFEIVHVLPNQVRGIVVKAEVVAGDLLEQSPPD